LNHSYNKTANFASAAIVNQVAIYEDSPLSKSKLNQVVYKELNRYFYIKDAGLCVLLRSYATVKYQTLLVSLKKIWELISNNESPKS